MAKDGSALLVGWASTVFTRTLGQAEWLSARFRQRKIPYGRLDCYPKNYRATILPGAKMYLGSLDLCRRCSELSRWKAIEHRSE
ncbi:MAG: hypothetical protein M3441_10540 [Chloroflexota bacterium]|nr:hypothetical protein [Chloroflexota bacterium]